MANFWSEINDEEALASLISENGGAPSPVLILKHSTRCAFSSMAKRRLTSNPDSRISYFIIDVIRQRNLSNALAEITGIRHESPQSFLFVKGVLVQQFSHMDIRPKNIQSKLDALIQI